MTTITNDTMITKDTPFTPADDGYHVPSDNPLDLETNWWAFNVPERSIGGWLHAAYYPNRGTVTWRVFAWDPTGADPARLAYYRKVADAPMPAAVARAHVQEALGAKRRVGHDQVHHQLGVRRRRGADVLNELVDDGEPIVAQELVLGHGRDRNGRRP